MATRYFCDGCDSQFPDEDVPNAWAGVPGQPATHRGPKIPLMTVELETQERKSFCGWACLAAYSARHATGSINWDALTTEAPDVQE